LPRDNFRWLLTGRALRSFGTAFLTVVFPLYLAQEGMRGAGIGTILTLGGIASAGLVVAVGLLGDRFGRRVMLVGLAAAGAVGGVLMAVTGNPAVVTLASGIGGVGRGGGAGSGGAWGPVFPAEQPLLASSVPAARRTAAFGQIAFVGVLAGAAGSLVALLPGRLHAAGLPWLEAYRAIFLLGALLAVAMLIVTLPLREPPVAPAPPAAPQPGTLTTAQLVTRLGLTNGLNGLGIGFLGPLLTYWFHVRYGVGSGELGLLYAAINLATALPYLGAARLAERLGAVRAVVVSRSFTVGLLLAMAVMPTFLLAGLAFLLRMAFNSLGLPARQSYVMGVADERQRGTVAALGSLPSLLTSTVSPVVGGILMETVLNTPLYGAAIFTGANIVTYYYAFRHIRPPEEARPAAPVPAPAPPLAGMGTGRGAAP
jgi:MFS family permease